MNSEKKKEDAEMDDTDGFSVRYATGTRHTVETYEEAIAAVRSVFSGAVIGHSGDCVDGGESTLVWASEELAENDDGSRACARIVRLHGAEVTTLTEMGRVS